MGESESEIVCHTVCPAIDEGDIVGRVVKQIPPVEEVVPAQKILPLAAFPNMEYIKDSYRLKEKDKVFLYTDGVPEATNANHELYGMERLTEVLKKHTDDSAEEILRAVRADVDAFVGEAPQFDNLTMLCFEYRGPQK